MTQTFYNVATLAGTLLSLTGVIIAIVQIVKTRSAAELARAAADQSRQLLARNVLLSDLSGLTTSIEELKMHVRHRRLEAALLRVTDLNTALIRLQHVRDGAGRPSEESDMKFIMGQLAVLRDQLERVNTDTDSEFNAVRVNGILSKVSDRLNHWVGDITFKASSEAL